MGSVDSELVTVRAMSPLTAGLSVALPCRVNHSLAASPACWVLLTSFAHFFISPFPHFSFPHFPFLVLGQPSDSVLLCTCVYDIILFAHVHRQIVAAASIRGRCLFAEIRYAEQKSNHSNNSNSAVHFNLWMYVECAHDCVQCMHGEGGTFSHKCGQV